MTMNNLTRIKLFAIFILACCVSQAGTSQLVEEKIMAPGSPISITETIWYGQTPHSPAVPVAPGLAFTLAPANASDGQTMALLAAYHLGTPFVEYYGGHLPRAIRVVAMNMQTGEVYQSDLNEQDYPPIILEVTDEEMANASPGWSTESSYFNVDLLTLLRIPKKAASYRIFLWLDNLISNVEVVDVTEESGREGVVPLERPSIESVRFGADSTLATMPLKAIDLRHIKKTDEQLLQSAWYPPEGTHPGQPVIWLLAMSHRDRSFGWLSLNADEVPGNLSPAVFQVDLRSLLELTDTRQKIFALAIGVSSSSQVLVFSVP